MQAPMFYGPGQQPGFLPPSAAGRGGVPFAPQPGLVLPQAQAAGRGGSFPAGFPPHQAGRGGPNPAHPMGPGMYGLPGQTGIPPAALQAGPAGFGGPQAAAYAAALAQAQAQATQAATAVASGRGNRGSMMGIPSMPMGMGGPQPIRGGPNGPTGAAAAFSQGAGRGNLPLRGHVGGFPPQARNPMSMLMGQPPFLPNIAGRDEGMASMATQALLAAPPQAQKQMIGEALYPKIHAQQPDLAGKVTGMLLEMDNAELLGL